MGDKGPIFGYSRLFSRTTPSDIALPWRALYGAMDIGPVDSLDPAIRDVEYEPIFW